MPSAVPSILLMIGDHECHPIMGLLRVIIPELAIVFWPDNEPDPKMSDAVRSSVTCVWEQVGPGREDRSSALTDQLPALERVARFPQLRFRFQWPFLGNDQRATSEPLYPIGRYFFPDRIAAEVSTQGLTDTDAYAHYLQRCEA